MDAKGARELARRIESNPGVAARPASVDLPAGALPLYQWFGGAVTTRETPPSSPEKRLSLRRRGR